MKKILAISLWVVAIGLWMPIVASRSPNPYQELYDEVLAPVVKVTTAQGTGSGVIIGTTNPAKRDESTQIYVLTAAHVVGNNKEVQVIKYSYRRDAEFAEIINATVIITDTIKDLALLHTPNPSQEGNNSPLKRGGWGCIAKLAPRDYQPYLFTEVYAVGCSLGLAPRPSSGLISAFSGSRYEISAPVLPGNSGGGVFLKDTHELIGITVWVRIYRGQMITTMAGVVPIQQVYEFLEECDAAIPLRAGLRCRSVYEFLDKTPMANSEEDKPSGLTCWSGWGSECAIGIRGPGWLTLLTKGGEKSWQR